MNVVTAMEPSSIKGAPPKVKSRFQVLLDPMEYDDDFLNFGISIFSCWQTVTNASQIQMLDQMVKDYKKSKIQAAQAAPPARVDA